jgi:uncharacterized protein YndB with AHSA1/START domain
MATQATQSNPSAAREFVVTRVFDAPRALVWKAWTEADRLAQWWGPKGCAISVRKLDLRPGGMFHYSMKGADGREMWGKFVYREIVKPERIVFVNSFSDENGGTARMPWMPGFPLEVLNTQTFTEQGGKTTVTLRGGPINATEEERRLFESMFENMQKGFAGTFDQLADHLAHG